MNRQRIARQRLSAYAQTTLTHVIDERGRVIRKRAKAVEGVGIMDNAGNDYPGGFTKAGEAYGSEVDSRDRILLFNGRPTDFIVGEFYPEAVGIEASASEQHIAKELLAVARELAAALPSEGTNWDDYMTPALSRHLKKQGFDPEDAPHEMLSKREMKKWPITKAVLDFYRRR